jgi:peptidyl-prolyl cis-trans isomerase C
MLTASIQYPKGIQRDSPREAAPGCGRPSPGVNRQERMSNMKTRRIGVMLLIFFMTLPLAFSAAVAKDKNAPDTQDKVAMVNGVSISQSTYDRELNLFERRIRRSISNLSPAQVTQVRDSIINDLVNRELLFQESAKQKIEVTEAEIQEEFDRLKERYKDPEQFEAILAQMQLTEESLKDQIRRKTAVQRLITQEVGDKITMTEAEAKTAYDDSPEDFKQKAQVHARHILIKVPPDADEAAKGEAQKKIKAIQKEANSGTDFAELAKKHSEGPSNTRGGDLGYFGRGQMVKPFEEAAFALAPGKISDIVETQFGYHLIKVEEKKEERALSFDEVKDDLMEKLKRGKIEKQMMAYLSTLREKAEIETYSVEEPAGDAAGKDPAGEEPAGKKSGAKNGDDKKAAE